MSSQPDGKIKVQGWRVESGGHITALGLTGSFYEAILQLFAKLVGHARSKSSAPPGNRGPKTWHRYTHELRRLYLWGDGVSATGGQLDETLGRVTELRISILSLLLQLSHVLTTDFLKLHGPQETTGQFTEVLDDVKRMQRYVHDVLPSSAVLFGLSGDVESLPESQISEPGNEGILEDIACYIDCLMDLCGALENPVMDVGIETAKRGEEVEVFNPSLTSQALNYCRKVRDQYPKMSKLLVERMGEANAERATRLLALRTAEAGRRPLIVIPDKTTHRSDGTSAMLSESLFSSSYRDQTNTGTSTSQSRSRFRDRLFERFKRRAKGLVPTQSQAKMQDDVASIASLESNSTTASALIQGRPRVPDLPEEKIDGAGFPCLACEATLQGITTRGPWKYVSLIFSTPLDMAPLRTGLILTVHRKHIYADLMPYCCTIEDCQSPLEAYNSTKRWASHELQHLLDSPVVQKSAGESHDRPCPFCEPSSRRFAKVEYFKHVGKHLREVSLAALPYTSRGDDDSSHGSASDSQPSPGLSILIDTDMPLSSPYQAHDQGAESRSPSRPRTPDVTVIFRNSIEEEKDSFASIPTVTDLGFEKQVKASNTFEQGSESLHPRHTRLDRSASDHGADQSGDKTLEISAQKQLATRLWDSHYESKMSYRGANFIPISEIERILSLSAVQEVLKQEIQDLSDVESTAELEKLTQDICGVPSRRRLFSLLLLNERAECIRCLVRRNIDDTHLPFFAASDLTEVHPRGDVGLENRLECFETWRASEVGWLLNRQHTVTAPFFDLSPGALSNYILHEDTILPFIRIEEAAQGGSANLWKVSIHSAHHNFENSAVRKLQGVYDFPDDTNLRL